MSELHFSTSINRKNQTTGWECVLFISKLFHHIKSFLLTDVFVEDIPNCHNQRFILRQKNCIFARCAKNQNKLCDSLGARVEVTMANNHKQVFSHLVVSIIRIASSVPCHMFSSGIDCKNAITTRWLVLFTNLASFGHHLERISHPCYRKTFENLKRSH